MKEFDMEDRSVKVQRFDPAINLDRLPDVIDALIDRDIDAAFNAMNEAAPYLVHDRLQRKTPNSSLPDGMINRISDTHQTPIEREQNSS